MSDSHKYVGFTFDSMSMDKNEENRKEIMRKVANFRANIYDKKSKTLDKKKSLSVIEEDNLR